MPRPRKPSKALEREGAYRHNPQRRRNPPKGRGKLPASPPDHLELERWEVKAWREIVASIPDGVATGSEVLLVEMASRLLGRLRRSVDLNGSQISQLRYILSDLGCSPAARERLGVRDPREEDDQGFGEFGAGESQPQAPEAGKGTFRARVLQLVPKANATKRAPKKGGKK